MKEVRPPPPPTGPAVGAGLDPPALPTAPPAPPAQPAAPAVGADIIRPPSLRFRTYCNEFFVSAPHNV